MSKDEDILTAKDVMSRPVVTAREDESVVKVAQLMENHRIGGVIVVDERNNPVGIVTERDLATRVVAKNLQPANVKVSEVMSKPLAMIDGETSIREAARRMSKLEIRRLAVMSKGELVGIITSKDILNVTPALIDILWEKSRLTSEEPLRTQNRLAGYCDRCGIWSDGLMHYDGQYYCEDCIADIEEESKPH
ncbi:MAG: CBS domain-containing protein [Candidatus Bathyarchaeia archaeon]|nr:CBS domain-containing protein [Candidatus Bathyarchaeota archaeon]